MRKVWYAVESGDVHEVESDYEADFQSSVLVYARCEEEALHLAQEYDAGRIGADNQMDDRGIARKCLQS